MTITSVLFFFGGGGDKLKSKQCVCTGVSEEVQHN